MSKLNFPRVLRRFRTSALAVLASSTVYFSQPANAKEIYNQTHKVEMREEGVSNVSKSKPLEREVRVQADLTDDKLTLEYRLIPPQDEKSIPLSLTTYFNHSATGIFIAHPKGISFIPKSQIISSEDITRERNTTLESSTGIGNLETAISKKGFDEIMERCVGEKSVEKFWEYAERWKERRGEFWGQEAKEKNPEWIVTEIPLYGTGRIFDPKKTGYERGRVLTALVQGGEARGVLLVKLDLSQSNHAGSNYSGSLFVPIRFGEIDLKKEPPKKLEEEKSPAPPAVEKKDPSELEKKVLEERAKLPEWFKGSDEQIKTAIELGIPVTKEYVLGESSIRMVLIPEGEITEAGKIYRVEPFYISIHEITNNQFRTIFPEHKSRNVKVSIPQYYERDRVGTSSTNEPNQPVIGMENSVIVYNFTDELSNRVHARIRIPTSREWRYVNSKKTPPQGNFVGNLRRTFLGSAWAHPYTSDKWFGPCDVGKFNPNEWGVYDLVGNVAELVSDDSGGTFYILGSCFRDDCEYEERRGDNTSDLWNEFGLRLIELIKPNFPRLEESPNREDYTSPINTWRTYLTFLKKGNIEGVKKCFTQKVRKRIEKESETESEEGLLERLAKTEITLLGIENISAERVKLIFQLEFFKDRTKTQKEAEEIEKRTLKLENGEWKLEY